MNEINIQWNVSSGGTVVGQISQANMGERYSFYVEPDMGFHAQTVAAQGVTLQKITDHQYDFVTPNYPAGITITVTFQQTTYNVVTRADPAAGGNASSSVATAAPGATVIVYHSENTGYQFTGWTSSPQVTITNGAFTMPSNDVVITAHFSKIDYTITKLVTPSGAGSISCAATANYLDNVAISQTANAGYRFLRWKLHYNGTEETVTGNSFSMRAANVTIEAVYEKITYTITATVSPAGAGTVSCQGTGQIGDSVAISQTPAAGYYFNGWTSSPQVAVTNGAFSMPASNVAITANYLRRSSASLNKNTLQGGGTATLTIAAEKTSYTHKYRLYFADNMNTGWVSVNAGVSSVNIGIPASWANQIPTNQTKSGGTMEVQTYNGSTCIGTYTISGLTYQVPADAAPTIGTVSTAVLRTVGSKTYANVGDIYVQGHCGVTVTVGTCTAKYSAAISSIRIQIGGYSGGSYDKTVQAASASWGSGLLTLSGTTVITITVTDGRGMTSTTTAQITVTAYAAPAITAFDVWRTQSDGTADILGTNGQYSYAYTWTQVGSNAVHRKITISGDSETDPALAGWLLPSTRKTLNILYAYNVTMEVWDSFEKVTLTRILSSGKFTLHFSADGRSVAVGHAVSKTAGTGYDGTFEIDESMEVWIGNMTLKAYIQAVVNGTI